MGLPTTTSVSGADSLGKQAPLADAELADETALIASGLSPEAEAGFQLNARLARLPVELDVSIPVRGFRVRNLLALDSGQVIETQWRHGEDMPLAGRGAQLAWTEFEVIDARLAVRVTRLA
jgi:flagellar motor switch protein FliN